MDKFFDSLRAFPFHRGPKRMVAGIAGGIADKFGWDVTLVRIGMLLSFLLPVVSIPLYLVLWLLIPDQYGAIVLERLIGKR